MNGLFKNFTSNHVLQVTNCIVEVTFKKCVRVKLKKKKKGSSASNCPAMVSKSIVALYNIVTERD